MAELSTLARPYAKAVFDLATADGKLDSWADVLSTFSSAMNDKQFSKLVSHPQVEDAQLAGLLMDLAKSDDAQVRNFVLLLAENNRLSVLPFIDEQFAALKAAAERRIDVTVTSAAPIDEAQREKLSKAIGTKLAQDVDVTWAVDESLVAGAIIRAGDVVIDGTVSAGLEQMRNSLTH